MSKNRNDSNYFCGELRKIWQHEDGLINHRLTWLLTSQALLFGGYGVAISSKSGFVTHNAADLTTAFCTIGTVSALVIQIGIVAAVLAMHFIWRDANDVADKHSPPVFEYMTTATVFCVLCIGACLFLRLSPHADWGTTTSLCVGVGRVLVCIVVHAFRCIADNTTVQFGVRWLTSYLGQMTALALPIVFVFGWQFVSDLKPVPAQQGTTQVETQQEPPQGEKNDDAEEKPMPIT